MGRAAKVGPYLIRNPIANRLMRGVDGALRLWPIKQNGPIATPKKILISNGAMLGDVVMTTSLLPALKEVFPDCHIGMLVGSWAKPLIIDHPMISSIFTLDHWKINRAPLPRLAKISHYRTTCKAALQQIKEHSFDLAIDTAFHFPNTIPLLTRAKIPTRLGFTTGGFGPLLTHPTTWEEKDQSLLTYLSELIAPLLPNTTLSPYMPPPQHAPPFKNHLIIHMGAGHPMKEWPHWKELVQELPSPLIFTGQGSREAALIQEVIRPNDINLCNQLTLPQFSSLICHAKQLLTVDTLAAHLASAHRTPCIAIFNGLNPTSLWAPPNATLLKHTPPCYPCYTGCDNRLCLSAVKPESVLPLIK